MLEMLRSTADFQQMQGQSQSRAHPMLLVRYRRNGLDRTRYGISTGRRIGGAVIRNRVRRRLRTILRKLSERVTPGWDVLLVARMPSTAASQAELEAVLTRLMTSAGVLAAAPQEIGAT
ncbi:MAG: ribonuclease P protein component [Candidatus Limnocylindrales bacterium]